MPPTLLVSVRVGKRKDPTRRHVGMALASLIRSVEVRVEADNRAEICGCMDAVIDVVVARAQRRPTAPCHAFFSECLAAALEGDGSLELVYCPPMPRPVTPPPKKRDLFPPLAAKKD